MNILKTLFKYLTGQQFTLYMDGGGGGGGSGTGTQTQISELPEWARGYAKDTLEKTAALSEKPYQAYDQNRIAGFSPMQQQAQQGAANMQTSGATGMGQGIAGAAALGGLNQDYDGMQMRSQNFGGRSAAQYMNPYVEQAMAPQLREAQRSSEMMGQQSAAKAVGQGAFGGSRSGLVEAERQRNLATQQGDIRAQGLNTAYNNAQSQFNADQARNMQAQQANIGQQQFGANLGLQGLNTALQGANTLGQLGGQQFQQGMDINKLQSAYGGQQQAMQQQGLSQAYQDFQNQQNYPYKQLGFMSDMVRGLPLGQVTSKSMYEPDPGMAQQIGSLGMGAYGLSKFMADGGMAYADGGSVDAPDNISSIVSKLSDQQLQQAAKAAQARGDSDQLQAVQSEMGMRASERHGIAGGVSNQMAQKMAGGGVVAFAQGGSSATLSQLGTLADTDLTETPEQRMGGIKGALPGIQEMYGPSATAPYMEEIKKERAGLSKMKDQGEGLAFLAASQALLRPGSSSRAVAGAMGAFGTEIVKMDKEKREADRMLRQSELTLATADQARKDGQIGKAESLYEKSQTQKEKGLDRQIGVLEKKAAIEAGTENAKIQAAATMAGVNKPDTVDKQAAGIYAAMVAADPSIEKDPATKAAAIAASRKQGAGEVGRYASEDRLAAQENKDRTKVASEVAIMKKADKQWKAANAAGDQAGMDAAVIRMIDEGMGKVGGAPKGGPAPAPTQQAPVATKGPDLNTFMTAARKANPGVSDADLKAYYNSTYK
jgi:hypothetical protein